MGLDKRRHYGRKIKRTKNLYRRRKTAGQKVFGTVMLVLAVSAIAFLGFCIGKPLLDYIGSIGKEPPAEKWTPAASYAGQQDEKAPLESGFDVSGAASEVSDESESGSVSDVPGSTVPVSDDVRQTVETNQPHSTTADTGAETVLTIPSDSTLVSAEAPASALSNRASLAAVLAKAKSGGFNAVVVQLKDRNGCLHYKSGIAGVADSVVDEGSMTLDEIISVFAENGMIPIAEIAVLSDDKGCMLFPDMSFKCKDDPVMSWLQGGVRRWANPESDAAREYFVKVTTELTGSGFEHILLTDVVFPDLQYYDAEYVPGRYFEADRYRMLYNVINTGSMIEMKASDVTGETFGLTAECLNDTSRLRENKVALVINRSDLPTDAGYPADAKTLVETILSLAEKKVGGLEIVPVIDGSGFDDAEKAKMTGALSALGYESYIVR